MNITEFSTLLVALGVGGIVGAAAAVFAASKKMESAYHDFKSAFAGYFSGKSDTQSRELVARFESMTSAIDSVFAGLAKLRRALRKR